jgi:type IV pilus assembly protein PilN
LIEVNLLPGGKKRSSGGRGISLSGRLPSFSLGGGSRDPYTVFAVIAGVAALLAMGWLFLGVRSDREETQVSLDEAVQDSVRFADIIERTNQLTARRDSIAQRVEIIQQIDADRFVWPHILDEISRGLPDYTWLREIAQVGTDPLQVRLAGRAGSTFAITNFMRNLEASRFLRAVQMERAEQAQSEEDDQDIVYEFEFVVTFESPPLDELETVPLFESDFALTAAVADSVGG